MKKFDRCLSIMLLIIQAGLLILIGLALRSPAVKKAQAQLPYPGKTSTPARVDFPAFSQNESFSPITRLAFLHTDQTDLTPFEVKTYTVQKGDTPWSIAQKFGLKIESILWANDSMSADSTLLKVGQVLNILPTDGVLHIAKGSDTLEGIARKHKVPVDQIQDYVGNGLLMDSHLKLSAGQKIIVPGGTNPVAWDEPGPLVDTSKGRLSLGFYSGPLVARGTGTFIWPVSPVYITQIYWSGHHGIDLGGFVGEPVYASDSGTVIFAKWDTTGYGNLIIIDHGNGYWTYYGHNSVFLVEEGQAVSQGQQIAEVGSTGNTTGPHVDFRIRAGAGDFLNPVEFLP